ncbi:hypothetical protein HK100_008980 [Physocladia obscura]|uniref:L domain-like protein n=1 Tax=Physocladia obscura TaxID=109957 RepID=A0AAD5XAD6_9FUNG|nr:hypothetical protein HK100_008980 [Physocladia obscura]
MHNNQPTALPLETIQEIVSWIEPQYEPWKYRALCRYLRLSLSDPFFVRRNLESTLGSGLDFETETQVSSKRVRKPAHSDYSWLKWPADYQEIYASRYLSSLTEISWPHGVFKVVEDTKPNTIPKAVAKLHNLRVLDLRHNKLSSSIPPELCLSLKKLVNLNLSNNMLSGHIPHEVGALEALVSLNLEYNRLEGPIPVAVFQLSKLEVLSLGHNFLDGSILPDIQNFVNLRILSLESNKLTGCIPTEFGNLIHIESIHLALNKLSGRVPATQLSNLPRLRVLTLGGNKFKDIHDFKNYANPADLENIVRIQSQPSFFLSKLLSF